MVVAVRALSRFAVPLPPLPREVFLFVPRSFVPRVPLRVVLVLLIYRKHGCSSTSAFGVGSGRGTISFELFVLFDITLTVLLQASQS